MDGPRILLENEVFHARIRQFLTRLAEQDHQYDPLDLFDIDIRRVQRQQPVDEDFALRWRQDADLLEVSDIASARDIKPLLFQLGILAGNNSGFGNLLLLKSPLSIFSMICSGQ